MESPVRAVFGNARRIWACDPHRSTPAPATVALALFLVVLSATRQTAGATFDQPTLKASKSLEAKLQILENMDPQPSASYSVVIITEFEANSYLKVHSGEFLPPGVGNPSMKVHPEHVVASADVDFNELSRSYPNPNDMGPKILAAMFHGMQHVTVTSKIQSEDAGVRVQVESVVVGPTTMPNWLVDYVIQNVLQPRYNFDLSKPLAYPDHVTRILVGSAQVIFLRGPKSPK